ncbi:H(+)/Cl(-) exchange transporter 7 [Daktulosphaira vitifoliae]|uniref:H(+)/Cl(-) exchange transporter 7 n=1 Tax=Daktulosphaira vitifoliae TaxID=58002 RepID=UPI0021AAD2EB|nr:H(+)/Cl(-) exchange transporter 7 [Daktulosphaira vitifoliae]XP_050541717.1 H(+)/Cl(-) exchange transporter 7 [Daktulosphaira vitifoliae]
MSRVNISDLFTNINYGTMAPNRKYALFNNREESVPIGSLNILSAKYESLDYEVVENYVYRDEERKKGYKFVVKKNFARWVTFFWIGLITATIGIIIDLSIEVIAGFKFSHVKKSIDNCGQYNCLWKPYLLLLVFNIVPVFIGSMLVSYVEPVALGSGIPQVKCYLNGVKIPRLVRIKTLFVKVIGVITTVVGGMCGGKEGPMIHAGAVVAAGISQGKSTTFNTDFGAFSYFREDHEKRDFVSGGAAAGVAAAFGSPVGGVLFSLEEGASFWNQGLTWRIFFASMISTFTLNSVLSAYHGHPGELTFWGLLNFGKFVDFALSYTMYELPIFVCMGIIGGLLGALFCHLNYKLTVFRMRYLVNPWKKVLEAIFVCSFTATVGFLLSLWQNSCKPLGLDPTKDPLQLNCNDGEYNSMASLWFQVPEASVRSFFHDPTGSFDSSTLALFAIAYYSLTVWTYGLSVSAGIFIPCLVTGAAWGRLIGNSVQNLFPATDVGRYALIGAASQLGGVVRMTISLTIILIEATGDITFGLPLMITLLTAKWIGDYFTESIYDVHIQLSGIPLMAWDPPSLSSNIYASEVMSHPATVFKSKETVGKIVDTLKKYTYNGFPVVDDVYASETEEGNYKPNGRLRGLILRSQLIVLLKNKVFNEVPAAWDDVTLTTFRQDYPRYSDIESVEILDSERNYTVDLLRFMNPSPYVVQHMASLPRIFRLFRAMGLRHIVVVNDSNEVVGVVTRKDLTRYREWRHRGQIGVEELKISSKI